MIRDRYQTSVSKFFVFTGISGRRLEQKARACAKKCKRDTNWDLSVILKFLYFSRERFEKMNMWSNNDKSYEKYQTICKIVESCSS